MKMKTSKSPVENEQGTEMFIHKRSNTGQQTNGKKKFNLNSTQIVLKP